jgi:hypothetical protein
MWYEINVSKDGKHYFATHERSISTVAKAIEIRDLLKKAMPEEEGFKYIIHQCQRTSMEIKN